MKSKKTTPTGTKQKTKTTKRINPLIILIIGLAAIILGNYFAANLDKKRDEALQDCNWVETINGEIICKQ